MEIPSVNVEKVPVFKLREQFVVIVVSNFEEFKKLFHKQDQDTLYEDTEKFWFSDKQTCHIFFKEGFK